MIAEISSIFLNLKDIFPDHKETLIGLLNQVMFLIAYTILRVIFLPFLVYRSFVLVYTMGAYVSYIRLFCMVFCAIISFLMTLMNFFWYRLIIRGLIKMLKA